MPSAHVSLFTTTFNIMAHCFYLSLEQEIYDYVEIPNAMLQISKNISLSMNPILSFQLIRELSNHEERNVRSISDVHLGAEQLGAAGHFGRLGHYLIN